ncbi:LRRC6 [Blepharisma stoltei]|uniref:Dynein axonemal assembly factor 11-like CS domain-containing protein n=1 Tax=Blepharisma stoltei TaxID=1481888 RepID=A0AAU9IK32_9CILI|nr:unnamed protein product [Blepharisma stoltei]
MVRITPELLRKRAEHNEGELSTLEEVTLHQYDIEKIEILDKCCRHLKILYLQNNIIPKMENLNKLKELEYLNLAVNNVKVIEGIDRCESLKKLDLTLNFIEIDDLEASLRHLGQVSTIEQLYMTGNPCTDWQGFRELTISLVPQLNQLDGKDITHTERLAALQVLNERLDELKEAIEIKHQNPELYKRHYTIESRVEQAKENERIQEEKDKTQQESDEKQYGIKNLPPPPVYNQNGEIRQCNQGNYDYEFYEKHDGGVQYIVLDIKVPRYLETSQIGLDLNPNYVRLDIKGKITQLRFPCEIKVEESRALRSQTSGSLQLVMPKTKNDAVPYFFLKEELEKKKKEEKREISRGETRILKNENKQTQEEAKQPIRKRLEEPEEPWEDDPSVPDLE